MSRIRKPPRCQWYLGWSKVAFEKFNFFSLLDEVIFLSSDGASVNSGKKSRLISVFCEQNKWMTFIWCFSHRLEFALKDSSIDESLLHLINLYKNSSKKHRNQKDEFEMYGGGIKPVKSTGTRWIDHRIRAMQRLVDKCRLYCQHLHHTLPKTKKTKDRIILQRKFDHAFL